MPDDSTAEPFLATLVVKIPFFILGVFLGMGVVRLALFWFAPIASAALKPIISS